jgi:hypothetical protein
MLVALHFRIVRLLVSYPKRGAEGNFWAEEGCNERNPITCTLPTDEISIIIGRACRAHGMQAESIEDIGGKFRRKRTTRKNLS